MRVALICIAMLSSPSHAANWILDEEEAIIGSVEIAKEALKQPTIAATAKPVIFIKAAKPVPVIEHGAKHYANVLVRIAHKAGIRGVELKQFVAQAAHESMGFSRLSEVGNSHYFRRYDPKYNRALADRLGNVYSGDGERFKGRGFIQLTGRDNYRRAGAALGLPLEQRPHLVEQPDIAAKTAVWFWKAHVRPDVTNWHDTKAVTKKVNGGYNGINERIAMFRKLLHI